MNMTNLDLFEDHVDAPEGTVRPKGVFEVEARERQGRRTDLLDTNISVNLRESDDAGKASEKAAAAPRWQPLPVRHPCPACGIWNWWSAGAGWVCRGCHPPADPCRVTATCFISRGIELIGLYEEGEPDEA